jgi:NADPH:quinone reductase-like Zn-dependent oxidoreductase
MHAIELTSPTFDSFRRSTMPEPAAPGRGRILVRMKSASLNYADLAVASGHYPGALFPNVPVADGAGEVIAVGDDVWQVAVGDRVAVHIKPQWIAGATSAAQAHPMRGATLRGSLVEIAELDAATVVKAPAHLSWEGIGALPIAAMTAWRALDMGRVGAASTVVVQGTGGVSIFALQLARTRGAKVIVTSSSDSKLARARSLGADVTVNYRERPDWNDAVLDATDGRGADLVIDPVGGDNLTRSIAAARHGGAVAAVGFLGGGSVALDMLPIIFREVRVQGSNGGSVADLASAVAEIAAHRIEPVIDRVFGVDEMAEAYRYMASGAHFGKLGVRIEW